MPVPEEERHFTAMMPLSSILEANWTSKVKGSSSSRRASRRLWIEVKDWKIDHRRIERTSVLGWTSSMNRGYVGMIYSASCMHPCYSPVVRSQFRKERQ